MKVVVIGGAGFLGSHIADELTDRGHQVTILDIKKSDWIADGQDMIEADISDLELLENVISTHDVVYHMAAVADIKEAEDDPLRTINSNIVASTHIMDLCSKYSVRLMYGSTVYVYSKHGSFYRATKQAVETLIEAYHESRGLEYTILRYGSLYGPRAQDWNGLKRIVKEMVLNKSITYGGSGKEKREYIHVKDASRMSVDVLEDRYKNAAITLTGIQVLTSTELLDMISEISDMEIDINFDDSSTSHSHYKLTPYQYTPKSAVKHVSSEYVDIGQGILELIDEVYSGQYSE